MFKIIKDIKENKSKKTLLLTAIFFIPVSVLLGAFFYIFTNVFQNSIYEIDSQVLNLEVIENDNHPVSEVNMSAPEARSFRAVTIPVPDFDESFIEPAVESLDSFQADDLALEQTAVKQQPEVQALSVFVPEVDNTAELADSLNDLEEDVYGRVLETIFPIFLFLLIIVLGLSYLAAKLTIRPILILAEKQKRFIADASHEIKTPLSLMKSEIEVFKKEHESSEASKDEINTLTSNLLEDIDRLASLSEKLLFIARLDSNQSEKNKESESCYKTDIDAMIKDLVTGFSKKYQNKKITFKSEPSNFRFSADCDNVKQVLEILVENACLHMKNGDSIKLSLIRNGGAVEMEVLDDGDGIDSDDVAKVFDRFYRSKNSIGTEGTGLGLSIAKELVEKDGGKIFLEQPLGRGTRFRVVYKAI